MLGLLRAGARARLLLFLLLSFACGFAQAQDMQRVHPQVMWAKLETLAEGARLASKQLWGR